MDALACQEVVRSWADSWTRGQEDIERWIEFAQLDRFDPDEALRLRNSFGGQRDAAGDDPDG